MWTPIYQARIRGGNSRTSGSTKLDAYRREFAATEANYKADLAMVITPAFTHPGLGILTEGGWGPNFGAVRSRLTHLHDRHWKSKLNKDRRKTADVDTTHLKWEERTSLDSCQLVSYWPTFHCQVLSVFRKPLRKAGVLSREEGAVLFGNWEELIGIADGFAAALAASPAAIGTFLWLCRAVDPR